MPKLEMITANKFCDNKECPDYGQTDKDNIIGFTAPMESRGVYNSYVERTHLTSRKMNGRLVHKTLSYSKCVETLEASSMEKLKSQIPELMLLYYRKAFNSNSGL